MKTFFKQMRALSLALIVAFASLAFVAVAQADVSVDAPQHEDFIFFVQVQVKPDAIAQFKALLIPYAGETRQEAGNTQYIITQSPTDSSSFMLLEHWASNDARTAHLSQLYTKDFFAKAGPLFMPGFPARSQFTELRGLE